MRPDEHVPFTPNSTCPGYDPKTSTRRPQPIGNVKHFGMAIRQLIFPCGEAIRAFLIMRRNSTYAPLNERLVGESMQKPRIALSRRFNIARHFPARSLNSFILIWLPSAA